MIKSAFFILILIIGLAAVGPWISRHTYFEQNYSEVNHSPSLKHIFGTDDLGRDLFTRVCYGIRISLFVAVSATMIDIVIGALCGITAGYFGGKIDELLMRFMEILVGLPQLLIVSLILVVVGPGLITIILAIALTNWISMARFTRAAALQIKQEDYIQAAKAMGAGHTRIVLWHILPNLYGSIIATLTMTIPTAIYSEAFLSFLGLGVPAPLASLGTMANEGLGALHYYPWRLFFPAGFICLAMFGFNLLGEGLRRKYA